MSAEKLLMEAFWVDRWMGSSAFLLPMEPRGLYREMLSQAWRRGARLPNDHQAVQRAVGCTTEEWDRCWSLVAPYWRVDGAWLVNDTQLEVYAESRSRADRAHEKAMKAAAASPQVKRKLEREAELGVQLAASPPSPSPEPYPSTVPSPGETERAEHVSTMLDQQRQEYAKEAWEAFLRKAGLPETRDMSGREWPILKGWMDAGVPLRVVLTAIRETKGTGSSLGYYAPSVKAEWDRTRRARGAA